MTTQEIPRQRWKEFFDSFSKQHEGSTATLEVFAIEVGAQEEAHDLPFEGISFESEAGASESVVISIGKSDDHVSHTIEQPEHVWLQQTDQGLNTALEIEDQKTAKTLLRFHS